MNRKIPFVYRVLIILIAVTVSRIADISFSPRYILLTAIAVFAGVAFWYLIDFVVDRFVKRPGKSSK